MSFVNETRTSSQPLAQRTLKGHYDLLIRELEDVVAQWRTAPFVIPGDWFQDEVEGALIEWQSMRARAITEIMRVLDEWALEADGVVRRP